MNQSEYEKNIYVSKEFFFILVSTRLSRDRHKAPATRIFLRFAEQIYFDCVIFVRPFSFEKIQNTKLKNGNK